MSLTELDALVVLNNTSFLGSIKIRLLINKFGSALHALEASQNEIKAMPGFGEKLAYSVSNWRSNENWKKDLENIHLQNVQLVSFADPRYPKKLLEIPDFPILLYVKGNILPQDSQSVAIVGTRNPSIYGADMARKISHDLSQMGFTIVSGLARGVDTAAHSGAIIVGRTLAVIGSGLSNIYPRENIGLCEQIAGNGAVMSEYPMLTSPDRQNFPHRNRIVSGLSLGCLLIEAPQKSGAMITMRKAYSHKRKLFVLPGRVDTESFRGNHMLIKEGARLIEGAKDIADSFSDFFYGNVPCGTEQKKVDIVLDSEERQLIEMLPGQELSIDELALLTNLPINRLSVLLMKLIFKNAIKELPGKIYKKA